MCTFTAVSMQLNYILLNISASVNGATSILTDTKLVVLLLHFMSKGCNWINTTEKKH